MEEGRPDEGPMAIGREETSSPCIRAVAMAEKRGTRLDKYLISERLDYESLFWFKIVFFSRPV